MFTPGRPVDEHKRQAAVDQLRLTDLEIEEAFERVASLVARLLNVPISLFTVLDRDRAFARAAVGLSTREGPRDLSFCSHTILQDDVLVVEDTRQHEVFRDHPYVTGPPHMVFYASVPVRAPNGQPVGALCGIDVRPRIMTPMMHDVLVTLGAVLEDELRLRLLSTVDHLTELFNRRQFDDVIEREWRRALRQGLPIALLTIDIDHFKAFNDRHGHLAGDDGLRVVSAVIKDECSRSGDQAFRTGGEEFAVVLPGTDEEGACFIAERLKRAIHELAVRHEGVPQGIVTLSIGVASALDPSEHELDELLSCADQALYAAKTGGRDRVVLKRLMSTRQ